ASKVERLSESSTADALVRAIDSLSADGPSSEATRIGDALDRVVDDFRGAPPTAVILLSDGVVTEGASLADAAQNLRSSNVLLLAVGIGSAKPPRDIELAGVLVDDVVYVNDVVSFQTQIKSIGLQDQPAKIVLRREGDSTPLAEESITL